MSALADAIVELDAEHAPEWYDDASKASGKDPIGCVMCWPKDGSWPCTSRMIADDLRALAAAEHDFALTRERPVPTPGIEVTSGSSNTAAALMPGTTVGRCSPMSAPANWFTTIPLNIVSAATEHVTEGKMVGVLVDDLERLLERVGWLSPDQTRIHDHYPSKWDCEGCGPDTAVLWTETRREPPSLPRS